MGIYKYLKELHKKPKEKLQELWQQRLIEWRKDPSTKRIDNPTRLDRARSLGYKAKEGYILVRVKLKRGGRKRTQMKKGRRTRTQRRRKIVGKSYQWVAEERANKKYPNCEVLNSYEVAKDGKSYWYEVILLDRVTVSKYKGMEWIAEGAHRSRVSRGKSAAGKRSRGILTHKGKGAEKLRPSLRARKGLSK